MRSTMVVLLFGISILLLTGCGSKEKEAKAPIELKDIPADIMKVAKEKLPDVTFERAMLKANGEYEIIGKNKTGKIREIDIKPDGTVVEIE